MFSSNLKQQKRKHLDPPRGAKWMRKGAMDSNPKQGGLSHHPLESANSLGSEKGSNISLGIKSAKGRKEGRDLTTDKLQMITVICGVSFGGYGSCH